jgi:hypothetical protein
MILTSFGFHMDSSWNHMIVVWRNSVGMPLGGINVVVVSVGVFDEPFVACVFQRTRVSWKDARKVHKKRNKTTFSRENKRNAPPRTARSYTERSRLLCIEPRFVRRKMPFVGKICNAFKKPKKS